MNAPVSPAIRHTTTAAVAAVGLIAAIVSYSHMQQLGFHHGEDWRSYLIPLSIDGLMAAASMVLLTRRRSGLPASPLAWVALVLGGIASLAANMADAQPNATAILYAGWAPLGFLLAFELLLQQRRAEQSKQAEDGAGSVVSHQPAEPALPVTPTATYEPFVAPSVVPKPEPVVARQEPPKVATKPATRRATKSRQTAGATAEERRAWVRQQRDNGRSVTGADVHKQFPTSPRDGYRIVQQVEAELDRELVAVAAGSR